MIDLYILDAEPPAAPWEALKGHRWEPRDGWLYSECKCGCRLWFDGALLETPRGFDPLASCPALHRNR